MKGAQEVPTHFFALPVHLKSSPKKTFFKEASSKQNKCLLGESRFHISSTKHGRLLAIITESYQYFSQSSEVLHSDASPSLPLIFLLLVINYLVFQTL